MKLIKLTRVVWGELKELFKKKEAKYLWVGPGKNPFEN